MDGNAAKLHVTVGFYPNGTYEINYVRDEDLAGNIEYNRTYRPGRTYFVDGEYACGGCFGPDAQAQFVAECRDRLSRMDIPMGTVDSRPYT